MFVSGAWKGTGGPPGAPMLSLYTSTLLHHLLQVSVMTTCTSALKPFP